MVQLLLFSAGEIRGAIPLAETSRVIRMVMPVKKAGTPFWEVGTINLHGKTLPVISIRALFGKEVPVARLTDMLIIARAGTRDVALWVDTTFGVEEIPLSSESPEDQHARNGALPGVHTTADGIWVISDLSGLIEKGPSIAGTHMMERRVPPDNSIGISDDRGKTGELTDTARTNAVLAERAKKVARPEEGLSDTTTVEVLRFRLAYQEYAIEMKQIREVILTGEITPVPGTPDFISGICVVRGEIISLVDLRSLLAIPEKGLTDLNRVIVLSDRTLTFGILADHITGIGNIKLNYIETPDKNMELSGGTYVKGIADGSLIVLDSAALFSDPRMIIEDT